MNAFLTLLGLIVDELLRLLRLQRAREIQEEHDANHANPQGLFADRFGPADSRVRDDRQQP